MCVCVRVRLSNITEYLYTEEKRRRRQKKHRCFTVAGRRKGTPQLVNTWTLKGEQK